MMMQLPTCHLKTFLSALLSGHFLAGWHIDCLALELLLLISQFFLIGDWPRNKHGNKSSNGVRSEARKEKAAAEATIRLNTADCGIPLGCTKKDVLNVAQCEKKATAQAYERSLLAEAQVIESMQKRMANLTKILAIPGLIDEHKTCIMEYIMKLMDVIQQKENLIEYMFSQKRKAPSVVEEFLATTTTPKQTPAATAAQVADTL
jgi:hypothetical protein